MTLENNNLKKKLTDGSFEELYQNTEDFQKLNCAKNAEEVLEILNKYGYNGNSETLIKEILGLLNEININDLKNVSGGKGLGKKLGRKLGGPALALFAGLTPNARVTATTARGIQLTTTAIENKLLDQELSKTKKHKTNNSSLFPLPLVQHASEIGIPPLLVLLINHFRGKNNLPANKLGNGIKSNASSDLPVLNYLYNELKDSLQTTLEHLDDLQAGQLVTFIHSLLQTINLKLNYFEKRHSSSDALLKKIFSNVVSDCKANMLILRNVEAYLNLDTNVNDTPPASGNPKEILTRFQEKLPNSPITNIIENLVNSTESEKVEVNAFEDVIEIDDGSYQHSELNDEDNEFDFTQSPMESIITHSPEPYDQDEHEDQQDPTTYPTKELNYEAAVNYLKRIEYLSDADPSYGNGKTSIWTIGENYASVDGYSDNLTLQEHIENYNDRLQSGDIKYTGDEKLVFITLIEPENEENGYNF